MARISRPRDGTGRGVGWQKDLREPECAFTGLEQEEEEGVENTGRQYKRAKEEERRFLLSRNRLPNLA